MDRGAEFYRQYLEGDQEAFSQILSEYRDGLIFFLNRTINNLDEAEELAAEAFAELIIHPGRYKGTVAFKTYLYAIGHHKMVDRIRKLSRHPNVDYDSAPEMSLAYQSFEGEILMQERSQMLHRALNQLSKEYQTVLHLIYFEDMSYEEAAIVMKKNKKQVDNLIYRGKNALRKLLEKEGFSYEE